MRALPCPPLSIAPTGIEARVAGIGLDSKRPLVKLAAGRLRATECSGPEYLFMTGLKSLGGDRSALANKIHCRIPVITLVLAATVVPVELRPFGPEGIDFSIIAWDVVANIAAYFIVGCVLGDLGLTRAIVFSAGLSLAAEISQSVMAHRASSGVDVATNVFGAALGAFLGRRWHIHSLVMVTRVRATVAVIVSAGLIFCVWTGAGYRVSAHGLTSPGALEAHWRFDEKEGLRALDSSGHGAHGKFRGNPKRVPGILGGALQLDGKSDWIECGRSPVFRLAGSMTLCAWIQSTSYPPDDAAIITARYDSGIQLDTTPDRGPRTIGFKLTDSCGKLMARYGATPLKLGAWYHLAGVYDADARTLDVYLNGNLDNGSLVGTVSSFQISSRRPLRLGQRSFPRDIDYQFAGFIDDVRIYSAALTAKEIMAVAGGVEATLSQGTPASGSMSRADPPGGRCERISEPEDSVLPAIAGLVGVLLSIAWIGFRPGTSKWPCLAISLGAGVLVVTCMSSDLPPFNHWLIPLTSLGAGISVVFSRRRQNT